MILNDHINIMNSVPDLVLSHILDYCREKQYRRTSRSWCRELDRPSKFAPTDPTLMSPIHFEKYIDWDMLSKSCKLSEAFMERWESRIDWLQISRHQKLSEEWIEKWESRVDWVAISWNQRLGGEFIEKWKSRLDSNGLLWMRRVNKERIKNMIYNNNL